MKRVVVSVLVPLLIMGLASGARAQGGGASSTGVIQGRVTDTQGAVLPGVTVVAAGPSMLGQQTAVSSENGNFRFPAVPPGAYSLTLELAGFNTVTYDLFGDGKTVLKGNYRLYYHNPGVVLASDANQNQPSKAETWSWNVHRLVQHHEQCSLRNHQPRDGSNVSAPVRHPGAVHGTNRTPVRVLGATSSIPVRNRGHREGLTAPPFPVFFPRS